jgi:hypothetical protein
MYTLIEYTSPDIARVSKLNLLIPGGKPKTVTEEGNEMKECSEMSSGIYCRVK